MPVDPKDFPNFTPVMQQYLKARHGLAPKTVLFFRMGDFYEVFFEDAEIAAKELDITLTGRPESRYPGGRIPMAGVPSKTIQPYVAKLIEKGYKVCIAEQMADPSTCKGLVPREITQTFTPGTISELGLLPSYQNNFIAAIYSSSRITEDLNTGKQKFGFAYADVSTGEFYLTELSSEQITQELSRTQPAEIIVPSQKGKKQEGQFEAEDEFLIKLDESYQELVTAMDKKRFSLDNAKEKLTKLFNVQSLDGYGCKDYPLGVQAAGAIAEYLQDTQKLNVVSFDAIKTYQVNEFMMLDANTRRNLELVKSSAGTYDASLMWAIDWTTSNLGKRRLRNWIEQPLFNIEAIKLRQDSVSELYAKPSLTIELSNLISDIYDIERLASRLTNLTINPREMGSLKTSLLKVPEIASMLEDAKSSYLTKVGKIPAELFEVVRAIESALVDEPPITITEGGVIREGFNPELDEYLTLVNDSQSWLKSFEETERERSGIKNLKVAFNKVHGYFIEISKANLKLVPENYIPRQTMVNSSRFITPELKEFEEKITNAESRRNSLEHSLYTELRKSLAAYANILKEVANDIANLDAICSLARVAAEFNFACPEIEAGNNLYIKDGRHPVIEQKLGLGEFVPNDIHLTEANQVVVLTGPNMAGKSTYMRQTALIILLAQIGSFVPATEAKIGIVDRIFTRIGASDDLSSGQSTFMVEMNETAAIINGMSDRSFIVLDEIGRGTSTFDGVSIAWAVLEYIAKTKAARTIFATHYHELADLEKLYNNIENYQMTVTETKNSEGKMTIEFLHKVAKGSADQSYGIEVARLAGLPKAVLTRAKNINTQLQARENNLLNKRKISDSIKSALDQNGDLQIDKLPLFDAQNT